MSVSRRCSKTACSQVAVATLTYAYADRAVVVGPLATHAEPHSYDLCADHATRLTPPRGWDIVRLSPDGYVVVTDTDDLLAVVDAVRERPAARPGPGTVGCAGGDAGGPAGARSHPWPPDGHPRPGAAHLLSPRLEVSAEASAASSSPALAAGHVLLGVK